MEQLKEMMNYKYKYDAEDMAMVRIYGFKVKLPEEFDSEEEEYIVGSSTNIVEELLNDKEPSVVSTIKSSSMSPLKKRSFSGSSDEVEGESVNLEHLIATDTLLAFVKNNIQSRLFQNYLTECS